LLFRCDSYRLDEDFLHLPKKLSVKWQGLPKWTKWTKQGLLTIKYDSINGKWYAYQPVEVNSPYQPLSDKRAYVDVGVINLLTIVVEGERQPVAYSGRPALADWWYLSHKIDRLKSLAKTMNNRESTQQMRRLFRRRRLRFRQYVSTVVRRAVKDLWGHGVALIVVGNLNGILGNTRGGRKSNAMRHNFWSHRYLVVRLKEVAEEYGVSVELVDEQGTSSICPQCGARRMIRRGRMFKCLVCQLEAHRDVVGAVNIGVVCGGRVNGVVAHPVEVCA
jgi:putative transposase